MADRWPHILPPAFCRTAIEHLILGTDKMGDWWLYGGGRGRHASVSEVHEGTKRDNVTMAWSKSEARV